MSLPLIHFKGADRVYERMFKHVLTPSLFKATNNAGEIESNSSDFFLNSNTYQANISKDIF